MYHLISITSMPVYLCQVVKATNIWMFGLMLVLVFALEGCGSKIIGKDSFTSISSSCQSKQEKAGTRYLPADDNAPLTKAELKALKSQGIIDRNISSHDFRDIILHFKKYVRRERRTVTVNMARAGRYLPHIIEIFRKEGLPEELACIAFIESGFNPSARSQTGALGVWQFTSSTGKHYGMSQNHWIDKRRDPYMSTYAAAQYFKRLYNRFKDWHLAVTAYNAGEGKLARALAATGSKTFFELRRRNHRISVEKNRLSEENKQYLPKFLAVCKIVRNLKLLGFEPVDTSKSCNIVEVKARPGTCLKKLSQHVGMRWEEFYAHNAAYLKHKTPPGVHSIVYLPSHKAKVAQHFFNKSKIITYTADGKGYKVTRGDTMSSIAKKTGISVAELKQANPHVGRLRAGVILNIPQKSEYVSLSIPQKHIETKQIKLDNTPIKTKQHTVRKGDTLYSIAQQYSVRADQLIAANNLLGPGIKLGQQLHIPVDNVATTGSCLEKKIGQQDKRIVSYQVQKGDSLWSIARKFNVPPVDLLALNNLSRNDTLRPGDYVQIAVN